MLCYPVANYNPRHLAEVSLCIQTIEATHSLLPKVCGSKMLPLGPLVRTSSQSGRCGVGASFTQRVHVNRGKVPVLPRVPVLRKHSLKSLNEETEMTG